jgi:hypothetical protein
MDIPVTQTQQNLLIGVANVVYLALFGAANWVWLRRGGGISAPLATVICFLPAALGAILAGTSMEDNRQYIARIMACAVFAPILLLFWSASQSSPGNQRANWPFAVGAGVMHVIVCAGAVLLVGSAVTRMPGAANVSPVDTAMLRGRLLTLSSADSPFEISQPAANELVASFRFPPGEGRSHAVQLLIDAENRRVRVRERLSANAARPRNESEASMRRLGDPYFDPTRPVATHVSGSVAQTTLIDPERLKATPVSLQGSSAIAPTEFLATLDGEGMLTLLCATVTRSGWSWEPFFFGGN